MNHTTEILSAEAEKLAPILRGTLEGGAIDSHTDIYAADYAAPDGDVYVHRAADLLVEMAAEQRRLLTRIDDLEEKVTEAERGPRPEWAEKVLAVIRKHSGNDGFDDDREGVDLPAELDDVLAEMEATYKREAQSAPVFAARSALVRADRGARGASQAAPDRPYGLR